MFFLLLGANTVDRDRLVCFKCSNISLLFILFHFHSVYSNGYGLLFWISIWLERVLCFYLFRFCGVFILVLELDCSYRTNFSSLWMGILFYFFSCVLLEEVFVNGYFIFYFWFLKVGWLEEVLVFVSGYGWNVDFTIWIVNLHCVWGFSV